MSGKQYRRIWRAAQLFIGFHRDPRGRKRDEAFVWSPKNGNASIHANPEDQETFLELKSADKSSGGDVQIKLRPDQIVLRREQSAQGWQGVILDEAQVKIKVNDVWITVNADGSVSQRLADGQTDVEADGTVLKRTEFTTASMSADGACYKSSTPEGVTSVSPAGFLVQNK